ncbi:MAG: hypothetical protein KGH49_02260 [Candidatus Micrarchaeota archaeon]|nr:hypothetical protein [Candidatus Micrarchaeota archaeon]
MEEYELGGEMEMGQNIGFDMKIAESDGCVHTVCEAEEMDLKRMIEGSCMHCNRVLSRGEVRVVPPMMVQEKDKYVSRGIVQRRIMCTQCYDKMVSSTRERIRSRFNLTRDSLKRRLFRAMASGTAGR